jgi:hypothetical protein
MGSPSEEPVLLTLESHTSYGNPGAKSSRIHSHPGAKITIKQIHDCLQAKRLWLYGAKELV